MADSAKEKARKLKAQVADREARAKFLAGAEAGREQKLSATVLAQLQRWGRTLRARKLQECGCCLGDSIDASPDKRLARS